MSAAREAAEALDQGRQPLHATAREQAGVEPLDRAWELLARTAHVRLGVDLPREAALARAAEVARDSSWSPLDYLLAWDALIEETGELPAALAALLEAEAAR